MVEPVIPNLVRVAPDAFETLKQLGFVNDEAEDAPDSIKNLVAHTYANLYKLEINNPRFGHYPSTTPLLVLRCGDSEWLMRGYVEEIDAGHIVLASLTVLARAEMPDIFD